MWRTKKRIMPVSVKCKKWILFLSAWRPELALGSADCLGSFPLRSAANVHNAPKACWKKGVSQTYSGVWKCEGRSPLLMSKQLNCFSEWPFKKKRLLTRWWGEKK